MVVICCFAISHHAKAADIETLVERCTPWADAGFSANSYDSSAALCLGYFVATIELLGQLCTYSRNGDSGPVIRVYASDVLPSRNTKSAIRSFLNWANNNPQNWSYSAITFSDEYITSKWPCD